MSAVIASAGAEAGITVHFVWKEEKAEKWEFEG